MEKILTQIDRKRAVLACVLAVFCSMGFSLSIKKMIDMEATYETLDITSEVQVLWRNIFLTFSANRLNVTLSAILIAIVVYVGLSFRREINEEVSLFLVALLFAVTKWNAYSYKSAMFGSIQYLFDVETESIIKIRVIWKIIAYTIFMFFLLKDAMEVVRVRFVQKSYASDKPTIKHLLVRAVIIFVAWLPYFSIFYPGTSNEDTTIQLMEYFEIPSYIQTMSSVQGDDIFITNHHPYILTELFGHFTEWGLNHGDIQKGVALYVLIQMIMLSLIFSIVVCYVQYVGATKKRTRIVLAFFALLPIFPMYATCMIKDTPYAAFCLLMLIMMWEVERTDGEVLSSWKFNLVMILDAFLMMLTKVYGEYVMAVVFIFYVIKYRKKWFRVLISTLAPVLVFHILYLNMFLPAMNVAPGGMQEALSVPLQQTARYVVTYPDEVTSKEKKAIKAIIPYSKIEKLYEPELSDRLKRRFNQEATDEELKAYFKVWWKMGLKHPLCYIDATLNNTYSYFDVSKKSSLVYYQMNPYLENHDKKYPPEEYSWLYIGNKEEKLDERYVVNQIILILQKIPGINLFLSLGMLPFIVCCMLILNISRGNRRYNMALLIPVLTVAICLLSPDNGNSRYVEPIFYALPPLMVLLTLPGGARD